MYCWFVFLIFYIGVNVRRENNIINVFFVKIFKVFVFLLKEKYVMDVEYVLRRESDKDIDLICICF